MAKNIVVCLDGTGNQLRAAANTNVVQLYRMLDLSDPSAQVAYYDPGVGTFSSQGSWTPWGRRASRLLGLAVGLGLRENLAEAYTFLMHTYEPGDRLYLFGFSRGAYTARALAGLLNRAGLLRPGAENLVPYAVSVYSRNRDLSREDWDQLHLFADSFSHKVNGRTGIPVELMGVWDSVKAAGLLRWNLHWLDTRQLPNVRRVRHAVSIDEKRRPYEEYLVRPVKKGKGPAIEEVWFAGVHSDVGGRFEDDPRLCEIALKWMVDGAHDAGLLLQPAVYQQMCAVGPGHATATVHQMGKVWALLTYRRRVVPDGSRVHDSVRLRVAEQPSYGSAIPETAVWDDGSWLTPRL